ncbi:MAG: hypothetical protein U1F35_11040 [Steroidobacteraceae bacterium]
MSFIISGTVLNYPIYDGNVSPQARILLSEGKVNAAIAEYRRLASLGSAMARCVLAYLELRGLPNTDVNLAEAKRLASEALGSEPGFANYILANVAMEERDFSKLLRLMYQSSVGGFVPAYAALAMLFNQGVTVPPDPAFAEKMFKRAIGQGHVPSSYLLYRLYQTGRLGTWKKVMGALMVPFSWIFLWLRTRTDLFSVKVFRHFSRRDPPMFNPHGIKD